MKKDYRTLAAKVFPGWEGEAVFSSSSMAELAKKKTHLPDVELVKYAGGQAGLGLSDMAQEFGGTLGK